MNYKIEDKPDCFLTCRVFDFCLKLFKIIDELYVQKDIFVILK